MGAAQHRAQPRRRESQGMSTPKTDENPNPPLADAIGSGFWRSARGENHGRNSRPGDVWVIPGDITDTDRLNWLIKQGPPGACEGVGLNSDAWDNAYCQEPSTDNTAMRQAIDEAMLLPNSEVSHAGPDGVNCKPKRDPGVAID